MNTGIADLRSHQANTTLAKLVDGYLVRCEAQGRAPMTIGVNRLRWMDRRKGLVNHAGRQ